MAKKLDNEQLLNIAGAAVGESGSANEAVLALIARKLQKEMNEEEETERIRLEARKRNAMEAQRTREQLLAAQTYCPHTKPNGHSNLAGQRGHNGTAILICQACLKTWEGPTVPAHLRIPAENIGGPHMGGQ